MTSIIPGNYGQFLEELKARVAQSRYQAARAVNKELILLYHHIGTEILRQQKEQGWGSKVIERLSRDLSSEFLDMKGFSLTNLKYMKIFSGHFTADEIRQQAVDELPWFHVITILTEVKDKQTQLFYIRKTREHGWSRNILSMQIETKLFERSGKAITNFSNTLQGPQSDLAQQTLKNPYVLDFLGLTEDVHERVIEKTLVHHIEKFLLELGEGFAFLGRQYHIQVEDQDFFIDLLFYHIKLRCFVAVELKAGKFKPEYAGKMNFYLSVLDDTLKGPHDAPSIGLILCRSKQGVLAEYALRDMTKPIGLAEYRLQDALPDDIKTSLPTIEELEAELTKNLSFDLPNGSQKDPSKSSTQESPAPKTSTKG